jgi:predicted ATPase
MITQLRIRNIRIFDDKEWIFDLPSVSVFCGTNSSGKSTILKSLLLLRQTQGVAENFFPRSGILRFIGSQVDLGNYKSFVSHEDISKDIYIGITNKDYLPVAVFNAFKSFVYGKDNLIVSEENNKFVDYYLKSGFTFTPNNKDELSNNAKKDSQRSDNKLQGILDKADFEILDTDGNRLTAWSVKRKCENNKYYYYFQLPRTFFMQAYSELIPDLIKEIPDLLKEIKGKHIEREHDDKNANTIEFRTTLVGLLPNNIIIERVNPNSEENSKKKTQRVTLPLHPIFETIQTDFQKSLESIKYLGPLRSPAQRYYLTPLDINPPMDPAGDFLPYIFKNLSEGEKYLIDYFPPGGKKVLVKQPLIEAVNSWLHYIRTGYNQEYSTKENEIEYEQTKVVLEFKIKGSSGNEQHALADSGFGYSQVLPILIRGLISRRNSTIIVEQPELHLNPALQARLAEFLISLLKVGKQVIIETHSEHIVNMIRVLVAEDESGELSKNSKIYYIDNPSNEPVVYDLSINQNGMVAQWPQSFFGEASSLTGRLLRAQKRFIKPKGE